jgi:8-oxo-dGTP pyrophosphatase MutT (NUDIX family)
MSTPPPQSLADGYVKWIRSQVGSQLIYLVYANVIIFDRQGRILAHQRYDFDWWSTTGGALEIGEPLAEAARREVKEETGLDVTLGGLVGVYSHPRFNLHYPNGDHVQQWTACFWAETDSAGLHPDGTETLDLFFVAPDELIAHTHPSHADMIRDSMRVKAGGQSIVEPVETVGARQPHYPLLRRYVGHAPIILLGATAIVEDDRGRILMTHRADFDCWDYPAGFADLGETTTANVVREVQEETGLRVEPYAIVGLYSDPRWYYTTYPNGDVSHGIDLVLACRAVGGTLNAAGNDAENTAVAFLRDDEILDSASIDATRQILEDYRNRSGWPFVR